MQIRIIAVGKLKEAYWLAAQAEYLKRLKPYLKVELIELADLPCTEGAGVAQEEQVREKEGIMIKNYLKPREVLITLDRSGRELSSIELATYFQAREQDAPSLVMVIGGSLGLSQELLHEAHLNLSFSKLTFPHQLFRVVLLEQIYRVYKINRHEPYHK